MPKRDRILKRPEPPAKFESGATLTRERWDTIVRVYFDELGTTQEAADAAGVTYPIARKVIKGKHSGKRRGGNHRPKGYHLKSVPLASFPDHPVKPAVFEHPTLVVRAWDWVKERLS